MLSHICRSIGCHFKRSVDTLIADVTKYFLNLSSSHFTVLPRCCISGVSFSIPLQFSLYVFQIVHVSAMIYSTVCPQVLPCLSEVVRWYDMDLLVAVWNSYLHVAMPTCLMTFTSVLTLNESVTHTVKLLPLVHRPPHSWQVGQV